MMMIMIITCQYKERDEGLFYDRYNVRFLTADRTYEITSCIWHHGWWKQHEKEKKMVGKKSLFV